MKWTDEEVKMLKTMSDEEIVKATGRTLKSVKMKRYRESGHYIKGAEDKEKIKEKIFAPQSAFESKQSRIAKIIMLARRLGVKLKGED